MLTEHETIVFLAGKKLRVTTQRIAVYRSLYELGHACAEDILELVRTSMPEISVATIYNTLETFADKGLISRINTGNNKMYFDVTTRNHPHTYCERTHKIADYMDEELNDMINNYFKGKKIEGFDLSHVSIQLVGSYH